MSKIKLARDEDAVETCSSLAEARATLLARYLAGRGGLLLDDAGYRRLRWSTGMTRGEIAKALDRLAAEGQITLNASHDAVMVKLVPERKEQGAA
ncbi:MAG TPA: hypothetical protein VML19_17820 [Verrucomicrobiae bacterium]|nr:hypothetical protein [Verrucomicrobiae bacterium]